jgi:hypothetical protein
MRQPWLSLLLFLIFSFASCTKTSEKDNYFLYLEGILGQAPHESRRYVLVSDYSCSACKEQVYREIEEKSSDNVCIILQPGNKAVLRERFQEAILEKRLFIDTARLNLERGIIIDKSIEIGLRDGKWVSRELDGVL